MKATERKLTDRTDAAHAAVRFSSAEWGALTEAERGQALAATREAAATGTTAARRLRNRARHRLKKGTRPRDVGPMVFTWPEAGARGEVWVPE